MKIKPLLQKGGYVDASLRDAHLSNCEHMLYLKDSLRSCNDGIAFLPLYLITNFTPINPPIKPSSQTRGFLTRRIQNGSSILFFASRSASSAIASDMPWMSPSLDFLFMSLMTEAACNNRPIDKIAVRGITIFFILSVRANIFVINPINNFFYGCSEINKNRHLVCSTGFTRSALPIKGCWEFMQQNPQLCHSQHVYNKIYYYHIGFLWMEIMVVILTNQERDQLIKEYKFPPQKIKVFKLKKKSQVKYKEYDIDLIDKANRKYKMIIRKNTEDIFDFTIILRYFNEKEEGRARTLTRYNGYHGIHTNVLENEEIDDFHIHRITEKYQKANQKDDGFAEITKSYNTFDDALSEFIKDNNVGQIWFNKSLF